MCETLWLVFAFIPDSECHLLMITWPFCVHADVSSWAVGAHLLSGLLFDYTAAQPNAAEVQLSSPFTLIKYKSS